MPQLRHRTTIHGEPLWPARATGVDDLVRLIAATPEFPGAACRGQHEVFDQARGGNGSARRAGHRDLRSVPSPGGLPALG